MRVEMTEKRMPAKAFRKDEDVVSNGQPQASPTQRWSPGYSAPPDTEALPTWVDSEDYSNAAKQRRLLYIISSVSFGAGIVGLSLMKIAGSSFGVNVVICVFLLYIGIIIGPVGAIIFTAKKRRFVEKQEIIQASIERRVALDNVHDNLSVENLIRLNRAETDQYHKITRVQAEKSFHNSQIAMFFGFAIVGSGAIIVLLPISTETKLAVAGISAVGTALAGYINRTFLKSHELSILQLNIFFRQPLVQSYLLTAERLAAQLETAQKSTALNKVILQAMDSAKVAENREMLRAGTSRIRKKSITRPDVTNETGDVAASANRSTAM
jgi:hypothetical protein